MKLVPWMIGGWIACGLAVAAEAAEAPRPLPVSAHNCYPADGPGRRPLEEALALGIDNIEIDVGWDDRSRRLIVGHDAEPRPGKSYPEFEEYLVPALEAHWKAPRADGAPTVLTVDWKTDHPDAVSRFKAFLDARPDWFSSAPKAAESPLTRRRLTVCLTGSDLAKERYDALIPDGGTYRAFRDRVFGLAAFEGDVTRYAPERASAYHRFLTFHWGAVERGGPPLAGSWTEEDAARLGALMDHLHKQGYRARFYTLNGHTGPVGGSYRLANDEAAHLRWREAAKAGVDWIATDEYADISRELSAPRP
jgi:hypothetical protein